MNVWDDYHLPPDLESIRAAARLVYDKVLPTPQYCWPLLSQACGCEVWVKHENHTPIGAFKVRGGLVYVDALTKRAPDIRRIITATSGNHGQSIAFAARSYGLPLTVVVPRPGAKEKKAAMAALGAELIEHGEHFNDAFDHATALAQSTGAHLVPSFHPLLVLGVASYALEFLNSVSELDTVYVPIGLGSGICGMIHVRDALGLKTRIVGIVPAAAPTYALSFAAGKSVATEIEPTILDALTNKSPVALALKIITKGADRIITVSDEQTAEAVRRYFVATHNLAEPGGAAAFAGLFTERDMMAGKRVGVVLSGANVDLALFRRIIGSPGTTTGPTISQAN